MLRRSPGTLAGARAPDYALGKRPTPGNGALCRFSCASSGRELVGAPGWPAVARRLCNGANTFARMGVGAVALLYRSADRWRSGGIGISCVYYAGQFRCLL